MIFNGGFPSKKTVPYFPLSSLMVTVLLQLWGLPTPSEALGDRRCYTNNFMLIVASVVASRLPRPPNPSAIPHASDYSITYSPRMHLSHL